MLYVLVKTRKGTLVGSYRSESCLHVLGRSDASLVPMVGRKIGLDHASLEIREGGVFIVDRGHKAGTYVNDARVAEYGPLKREDTISIGDYRLQCHAEGVEVATSTSSAGDSVPELHDADISTAGSAQAPRMAFWRATIRRSLVTYMDLRRINVAEMDESALRVLTSEAIDRIIQDQADLDADIDREELARQVLAEAVGLGPLEPLIADDSISEIMVNSRDEIFYEKSGVLQKSEVTFTDDSAVVSAIERIVSPLGRRIDESSPMVDARLKDGSRVNAVIPPLALKGPNITIRKFMKERLTSDHLLRFGSMDEKMVGFLELAVEQKKNILISGGTGSGKTTLLNVLSNFIPDGERIITVEDAAELKLYQPNLISLEARPSNQEGKGEVTIRDLVKNCLRMRPDRIVVGECRGGEALDMLQAMNTGHDGSLTTIHANTPRDCLSRIEVLVLMSGMELPVQAIREQITSAIDIIVQQTRFSCGSRKVTSITEVNGIEAGVIQLSEIFRFAHSGYGPDGKVSGEFVSTGNVPDFVEGLRQRNVKIDMRLFNNVHKPQDPGHGF